MENAGSVGVTRSKCLPLLLVTMRCIEAHQQLCCMFCINPNFLTQGGMFVPLPTYKGMLVGFGTSHLIDALCSTQSVLLLAICQQPDAFFVG